MGTDPVLEVRDAPDNCPHCGAILTESGSVMLTQTFMGCIVDEVLYYDGDSIQSTGQCMECGEELASAGEEAVWKDVEGE